MTVRTPPEAAELAAAYAELRSIAKLADRYGASTATVAKWLREAGIPRQRAIAPPDHVWRSAYFCASAAYKTAHGALDEDTMVGA